MKQDKTGRYNPEEIAEQKEILQKLSDYKIPERKVYRLKKKVYRLSTASDQTLLKLKAELKAIDLKKNALANRMSLKRKEQNCKELVDQIKNLREEWLKKKDEIYFYIQHGSIPAAKTESDENELPWFELPDDPVELHKTLLNARSYLSNLKKRKGAAKTASTQLHYDRKITMQENKIVAIEDKQASL